MNENSKIYIVLGVVVAIVATIICFNIYTVKRSEKIYNSFLEDLNSTEEKIVFIGREGCSWCQLFQPIFDYYANKYEFTYQYIDTEKVANKHFNQILDKLLIDAGDFGTPLVVFVKEGKVIDKISGYVDERELLNKLKDKGYISKEEGNILTYLDFDGLKKVFKSKEKSIVVVGKTSCSYCIRFKPILMSVSDEYNVPIYYVNYDEIEETEELSKFLGQFEEFQGSWGTPFTVVVENGKIIDKLSGYREEKKYINFLKNNDFIKE